ncbi:hypothetical protein D9611_004348 [Ephemerocybe angulata]|uniref:Uncharacterized protein n=1 Tax=Ephemerocybe angulata TaxID=980116 RepID=A0A8H5BM62_9AGAR|nr:hypothetical protein D9611_004348 [Tulosesus angulatus]
MSMHRFLDFPLEIWIDILRSAADVPDPLVYPQLVHKWDSSTVLSQYAAQRYRDSLSTKRNLVGVCRQWYRCVVPYLYEHISVKNREQMHSIVQAAAGLPTIRDQEDERTLGSFIRRLDLLLPGLEWEDGRFAGTTGSSYSNAPLLCSLAPNLLTIITTSDGDCNSFPLSDVISSKLEYLYWINTFSMPIPEWVDFMDKHPRLIYMDPPFFEDPDWRGQRCKADWGGWRGKSWPALEEMVFHRPRQTTIYATEFPTGSFPGLVRMAFTYQPTISDLEEILAAHGANLKSIHFQIRPSYVNQEERLDKVKVHCPDIKELMVTLVNLEGEGGGTPGGIAMPQITTFCLQHASEIPMGPKDFCEDAIAWIKIFPSLREICIFEESNVRDILEGPRDVFLGFLENCTSLGIAVKDSQGCIIDRDRWIGTLDVQ